VETTSSFLIDVRSEISLENTHNSDLKTSLENAQKQLRNLTGKHTETQDSNISLESTQTSQKSHWKAHKQVRNITGKHTETTQKFHKNTHKDLKISLEYAQKQLRNLTGTHTETLDSNISLENTQKQLRNLTGKHTETQDSDISRENTQKQCYCKGNIIIMWQSQINNFCLKSCDETF
jgi:hypothetical protein